jgi:peptide/bleomycin uptake transporter
MISSMLRSYYWSKKWSKWAWGVGLILLLSIVAQVYMSVLFNEWYRDFYNLLDNAKERELEEVWASLLYFCKIAFPYVFLITASNWIARIYTLRWREAITFDYIPRWTKVVEDIEGASQRIQEDAQHFAVTLESLGLQAVRAVMTLIAFLPILWGISATVTLPYLRDIPGSLVWVALGTSIFGVVCSWYVGYFLPGLEYNNQRVEAAFRKELVKCEDHKEILTVPGMVELFTGVRLNYQRLYLHYGYFDIWANMFSQAMILVPFVAVLPGLFEGTIALGVVMQVNNAFVKVNSSFDLFLNNWTTINRLRSIIKRLKEFEINLDKHQVK